MSRMTARNDEAVLVLVQLLLLLKHDGSIEKPDMTAWLAFEATHS